MKRIGFIGILIIFGFISSGFIMEAPSGWNWFGSKKNNQSETQKKNSDEPANKNPFNLPWLQKNDTTANPPKGKEAANVPIPSAPEGKPVERKEVSVQPASTQKDLENKEVSLEEKEQEGIVSDVQAVNTIKNLQEIRKSAPETADADVAKIQADLNRIVNQTKTIQVQNQVDRAKLQKILEQVEMQKRLIQTVKVPVSTSIPKNIATSEQILRSTKVRLISEDLQKTQQAVENLNRVQRASKAGVSTPAAVKRISS